MPAKSKPRCRGRPAVPAADLKTFLDHLGETASVAGAAAKAGIQLEKKDDMKKRGLASPDIADALALTFALPVTPGWDLPPVQEYCVTEYDLYRDFDEDYWDEKDEFDE